MAADDAKSKPTGVMQPTNAAEAVAAATTGGGCSFDFVFNNVTYNVQIYAPDTTTGQYGFVLTQATTTIASLIYKDEADWAITVGLPSALQVDTNLTVNAFNINIAKGAVGPFAASP